MQDSECIHRWTSHNLRGFCWFQVNFPLVLDCYEFCSDEYKRELQGPREAYQQVEDKKAGVEKQKKDAARKEADEKDQSRYKHGSKKTRVMKTVCLRDLSPSMRLPLVRMQAPLPGRLPLHLPRTLVR